MNSRLQIKNTPFFKLNKKEGKNYLIVNLKQEFGFTPEIIVVERLTSRNNVVRVSAILPKEIERKVKVAKRQSKGEKDA